MLEGHTRLDRGPSVSEVEASYRLLQRGKPQAGIARGKLLEGPPSLQPECSTGPARHAAMYVGTMCSPRPLLESSTDPTLQRQDPKSFRIKQGNQATSCFLAQYSFGHHLPHDLLTEKGLLGSLVEVQGLARFFAPAEIASLHGSIRPALCHKDRRLGMRLCGNSISVPHAAIALLKCCHTTGLALQIQTGSDWLFCPTQEVARHLCTAPQPSIPAPRIADLFRTLTLQTASGAVELQVPHQS